MGTIITSSAARCRSGKTGEVFLLSSGCTRTSASTSHAYGAEHPSQLSEIAGRMALVVSLVSAGAMIGSPSRDASGEMRSAVAEAVASSIQTTICFRVAKQPLRERNGLLLRSWRAVPVAVPGRRAREARPRPQLRPKHG